MLGAHSRDEIDEEGEDVKSEDESDGPLQDGGSIVFVLEVCGGECDGEDYFDDDEEKLDPEGNAENAVFTEICSLISDGETPSGWKGSRIPRRWYSQQMKMAETTYPTMNKSRKMSCRVGCLSVSKILSKIKPAVPMIANTMDNPLRTFSVTVVFLAKRPRCRSHLSDTKAKSRKMVVTTDPAMKSGLSFSAPTSEM